MSKADRTTLDGKVLAMAKRQGTVCPNTVASTFNIKWETARRSLDRLCKAGQLFYHPEMGKSPMVYSIWPKVVRGRQFLPQPDISKTGENGETTDRYARLMRAVSTSEVKKVEGFVCHPKTVGSKLGTEFVGAHWHGQFTVEILTVGSMPETFALKDSEIVGGWLSKTMPIAGNVCYYGHIKFPYDRDKFAIHTMTAKDGKLNTLSIYVHRRYVYYVKNDEIAMLEFTKQVEDVCNVLRGFGWDFGTITPRGFYSAALNSREFAANVPKVHVESSDDIVTFDSSVGSADGVCTEAEIIHDHPTASEEMRVLVEAPSRILRLEQSMDIQSERIADMDSKVDRLIGIAEKTLTATELSMTLSMGGVPAGKTAKADVITTTQGDVMYGRL